MSSLNLEVLDGTYITRHHDTINVPEETDYEIHPAPNVREKQDITIPDRFGWCAPGDSAGGGNSREIEILQRLRDLMFNNEGVIIHHPPSVCAGYSSSGGILSKVVTIYT